MSDHVDLFQPPAFLVGKATKIELGDLHGISIWPAAQQGMKKERATVVKGCGAR
jgi:hypothetical protein